MSGTHRPFSDGAGYTRHCWECANATGWGQSCGSRVYNATSTPNPFVGTCSIDGSVVDKFDSPNNPCLGAAGCTEYRRGK